MSEYKRLTKRNCAGYVVPTKSTMSGYSNIQAAEEELLDRLAELEDKIEAGTLVTVPYAIGQELYCVDKKGYRVSLITIKHDGSVDIRLNRYNDDGSYCYCFKYKTKHDELFNNEVDAKKRLEEIRNGNEN